MVDRDVLSARLSALEGYLAELEAFREIPRGRFVSEPGVHHLAERFLHLAAEAVADVAHHVIADLGYRQPTGYKDAFEVLQEEELLDRPLADRLKEWMGFRNVLVHLYLSIDHGRSWEAIQEDLEDLRAFARAISVLLDEPEGTA